MFTQHTIESAPAGSRRAIGAYTLSTLANRMTGAPVDEKLRAFA